MCQLNLMTLGTNRDGQTYILRDTGDAMYIQDDGVYRFDILMHNDAECNAWGVRYGTAIIGGEVVYKSNTSGSLSYAEAMFAEGEKYLDRAYVWGGSTPSQGFDCSGFVCWVINHSGAGSIERTTAQEIYNKYKKIPRGSEKRGDLIFFTKTYNCPDPVSHVGIVAGNGRMLHCGNPISYVSCNTAYWNEHFYGFGRIR